MDFLCRVCGKREGGPQGWRLVIELGKPGTAIRNTFFILDQWDEKKAMEPNAACFCSRPAKKDISPTGIRNLSLSSDASCAPLCGVVVTGEPALIDRG